MTEQENPNPVVFSTSKKVNRNRINDEFNNKIVDEIDEEESKFLIEFN